MSNACPRKFLHVVTNFVKHPANLAVDSLAQNDANTRWADLLQCAKLSRVRRREKFRAVILASAPDPTNGRA